MSRQSGPRYCGRWLWCQWHVPRLHSRYRSIHAAIYIDPPLPSAKSLRWCGKTWRSLGSAGSLPLGLYRFGASAVRHKCSGRNGHRHFLQGADTGPLRRAPAPACEGRWSFSVEAKAACVQEAPSKSAVVGNKEGAKSSRRRHHGCSWVTQRHKRARTSKLATRTSAAPDGGVEAPGREADYATSGNQSEGNKSRLRSVGRRSRFDVVKCLL
jgi:hypothetical protein